MSENAQAMLGLVYFLVFIGGGLFVVFYFRLPEKFARQQQQAQVRRMKTQIIKGQTDRTLLNQAVRELHEDGEL